MKTLRTLSILEGSSLILLLLIAVPLKHMFEMPQAVMVIGPIHGFLFIAFNLAILFAVIKLQLKVRYGVIGFLASLIPLGTFIFKAKILNKPNANRLDIQITQ